LTKKLKGKLSEGGIGRREPPEGREEGGKKKTTVGQRPEIGWLQFAEKDPRRTHSKELDPAINEKRKLGNEQGRTTPRE